MKVRKPRGLFSPSGTSPLPKPNDPWQPGGLRVLPCCEVLLRRAVWVHHLAKAQCALTTLPSIPTWLKDTGAQQGVWLRPGGKHWTWFSECNGGEVAMIYISNELSNHITRLQSCQMYITFPVFLFHKVALDRRNFFLGGTLRAASISTGKATPAPR